MMSDDGQLLLDYARTGDVKALSALVVGHAKMLTAYLRGFAPSEDDAEDAFQETWLRVIRSCRDYRGGSVRAYLLSIAHSVVFDSFRRTRQTESLDSDDEEGLAVSEMADEGSLPNEAVEVQAAYEEIREAVRGLPDGPREVLLMRVEGELSYREIAEVLGVPNGTAKYWMHQAVLGLRKLLGVKP